MRVFQNPVDGYNAALDRSKSMGKGRFPQFYWGFVPNLSKFTGFSRFLSYFWPQPGRGMAAKILRGQWAILGGFQTSMEPEQDFLPGS
jgi:hypothetical protein